MPVIHEHNQQKQDNGGGDPLPSSPSTSSNPHTTSTPPSLSPILIGLLASTAVLRVVWGNLRVPMGVDATTLLPADAQLGILVVCSMIGTLLRGLLLHYTTESTDSTDSTNVALPLKGLTTRPMHHYLSLFALLLAQLAIWTHWIFSNASKFDWAYPWLSQIFDWAPSQISSLDWAQSLQVYYKELIWALPLTGPVKFVTTAVNYLTRPLHHLTGTVDLNLTGPVIWHLRPYLFLPRIAIITSVLAIVFVLFSTNSKAVTSTSTTTKTSTTTTSRTTTATTSTSAISATQTRLLPRPSLSSLSHMAVHVWTLHGLSLGPLGAPALLATMVTDTYLSLIFLICLRLSDLVYDVS